MGQKYTKINSLFNRLTKLFLSAKTKALGEKLILRIAILSYLGHLAIIYLSTHAESPSQHNLLNNPISAIYTPFSFILIYEVYLLIFYLPKSTSVYIAKQYEIITLIVIRRIFKDIGNINLSSIWFQNPNDLQFTFDTITSLILFLLIYFFYKNIKQHKKQDDLDIRDQKTQSYFIQLKQAIAFILVPILFILASTSLYRWIMEAVVNHSADITSLKNVNNVFFDDFFNILIIVDVLLLLTSFFYSDKFHTIIRNSGFVISTILIKISFSVDGIMNNALIIGSVLFGLGILHIYNLFESPKNIPNQSD